MNYYLLKAYIQYWLRCVDEHSLHSPFVYDIYTKVIKPSLPPQELFPEIEDLRKQLQSDHSLIKTKSFGAPSTLSTNSERSISNIARMGVSGRKYSELYYSLARHLNVKTIWELGTSLGLNTLYLASVPDAKVTTFEGCRETLSVAKGNFDNFNKRNISTIEGNLDDTLFFELGKVRKLDMVFFDANHRFEPTTRYFEACAEKTHAASVFIFDDIHWSAEMNAAWQVIMEHPLSRITIDLFQSGLVFFDTDLPKQHFILDF